MTEPAKDVTPEGFSGVSDDALCEINRLWTIVRAFSNAAHDVNNALQVMAGSAELLEGQDLAPAVRRRVEAIRTESARAAAVVERLLAYARATPQPPHAGDVWPLIEAAVALRAASAGRQRITLAIQRMSAEPCRAVFDPSRTLQVLLDLLLEAEGAVLSHRDARIAMTAARDVDAVVVRVSATAGGPQPGDHDSPMASPAIESVTGGAQLRAARLLAESMGGQVDVKRTDGEHTFALRLHPA